ncbi:MAG: hypothetical protein E6K78_08275 [Candidatus Eisenbacteria bacterium]|uniref:Uncharacterized protein n=1 Tax=Eiseniibacteriota bacterium TaxID=2212470 RepID=A0A538TNB7_UNCEI|nr:MAG: hypothetical protein E6K78_08275 [Candidatus Eisenbacteria bacterium]
MAFEEASATEQDRALLERLATRVVELHMEVPAILALETARPLAVVASQAMIFLEPLAQAVFPTPDYRRFAVLVERRENLEFLLQRIEAHAATRGRPRDASRSDSNTERGG